MIAGVFGGMGQFGIITRAVVDMVRAPTSVRNYVLNYTDNATFFKDMRELLKRNEVEEVSTLFTPDATGRLVYGLNIAKHFEPSAPPNTERLLRGLSQPASAAAFTDQSFQDYSGRVDAITTP